MKLPHPFRTGDVVKYYDNTIDEMYAYNERYVIVSAEQPESAPGLNRSDMSATLVPYEFRDKPDAITYHCEKIGLLFLEMYEEE